MKKPVVQAAVIFPLSGGKESAPRPTHISLGNAQNLKDFVQECVARLPRFTDWQFGHLSLVIWDGTHSTTYVPVRARTHNLLRCDPRKFAEFVELKASPFFD